MVEHLLDPFPRDIPWRLAVDGVADGHVVGGNRLRDGSGCAAHGEEPAGHLLPSADLGEVAVDGVVEIDGEGPLSRRIDGLHRAGHGERLHGGLPGGDAPHPGGNSMIRRRWLPWQGTGQATARPGICDRPMSSDVITS